MRRLVFLLALACSSPPPPVPTTCVFDLEADLTNQSLFWSMPYPSDLRLMAGAPDVRGFPNSLQEPIIDGLQTIVMQRSGFPQMPTAYFQFTAPLGPQDPAVTIPASTASPILLVDIDASSPERGRLFPVLAGTPVADRYLVDNTLEVAPLIGVVLEHSRTYAFVVMKSLRDASGALLGAPQEFAAMEQATVPLPQPEASAWNIYQPLWPTLAQIGVSEADVAVATVFTTGDVVQSAADLATKVIAQYSTTVTGLNVPTGGNQSRFCEIVGQVSFPQFQQGTPPFDTEGLFDIGSDGLPIKQEDEVVPMAISLPQGEMPVGGWPLILYFHGSGGLSTQIFDGELELDTPGLGPAYVVAPYGFAMASSALPLNPERYPAGSDIDYINFNNLACFPYTFEQGTIEQRMFISALTSVTIDPSLVSACTGMSLPAGETAYHFQMAPLHIQGQSMGGMYTNLVGATDARAQIAVPTGAGGYWSYMVLTTQAIMNAPNDLKLLLGSGDLTFMHPALHLLETAWEPAEPFVYMPRLAHEPLAGHPVRPIYEPVGYGDSYFSTGVYDGAALAYENKEAGDIVWPTMQTTLATNGLDGIVPYPVVTQSTGTVVQYMGDGVDDPHYIALTLDAVKYQYACFHQSFQQTGIATLYAPQAIDSPCGP
jgi:hypothetical protein